MTCTTGSGNYTTKQKKKLRNVYSFIANEENNVYEKINVIEDVQVEFNDKTLFNELKNLFILQDQKNKKAKIIEFKPSEIEFANMVKYGTRSAEENAKPMVKAFMLDGTKYIAIHSEESVRVLDSETMLDVGVFQTHENDIKQRNVDIVSQTSDRLSKDFNEEVNTLGSRIVQDLRNDNPIKNGNEIPIERRIVSEKKNSGLFANIKKPFSKLNLLLNGNKTTEPDHKTYAQSIEDITAFIPTNIKEMILGDESPTQNKEFMDNMQHFLNIYDSLNVPIEETWEQGFKLKENGDIVQIKNSKYENANYLQILGTFKKKRNTSVKGKTDNKKVQQSVQLVLDPAVEEIVKFYAVKAMADMKEMIENLNGKDISEIARALNVDVATAYKLKNEFIEQNTIPVSSFISDAAKDAYNQLGITIGSDVNMDIKDGVVASLKALISATLVQSDYITHDSMKSEQKEASRLADEMKKDKDRNLNYDAINQDVKQKYSNIAKKYNFNGKHFAMYTLNEEAFGTSEVNGMKESFYIVNKLKYLNINEKRKVPSLEPKLTAPKTILNSSYNANPDIAEFIKEQNSVAWSYKEDFDELYEAYQKTIIKENDSDVVKAQKKVAREEILTGLGKVQIDTDKQHISELKVLMSNNDKIERELEVLISMYPQLKGKEFYVEWVETASGRATIASDMHPQESKLIRSFIEQPTQEGSKPGHNVKMASKDFKSNSKKLHMLEMAMAQAFDMDPDKNSKPTILKSIREVVDITGSGIKINTDTDFGKALYIVVFDTENAKNTSIALNMIFDKGEGHHGLQAARMLKRLNIWKQGDMKKPFNNDLTIETDAITSGMMLTLMQIVDSSAIEFLAKGGIYTQDTKKTWSAYTKKWLKLKYGMEDIQDPKIEIEFGPAGLIEAGNFHQELLETDPVKLNKLFKDYIETLADPDEITFVENIRKDIDTTEVFQDMYKTIGIEMQSAVEQKTEDIKNELISTGNTIASLKAKEMNTNLNPQEKQILSSAEKLYDRLKLQHTMLKKIGKITPKKLRAIAKDPVMTYIYGSMIASIRKNLGGTVGVKHFVDSIKIKNELESQDGTLEPEDQEALNIANDFIDATMKAVDRRTSFGREFDFDMKKSLKYKELDGENRIIPKSYFEDRKTPIHKVLMNLEIDDNIVGVLTKAVNDTFGDAIADAFEAKTGSVDNYRNIMKSIELFTFELFRAKTETAKRNLLEKYDGVIPDFEFKNMLKNLEETGFGHDAPTGDADTATRRLPLLNMEVGTSTKEASVTIKFNRDDLFDKDGNLLDKNVNEQTRAYAYLTGREFASNTGAAPTTTIHQMDSRGITVTVAGNSWLSIYDAVVQASDPANVKYVNDTYNKTIFDQNSQRDILGDNTRKMMFMMADLVKRYKDGDKDAKLELQDISRRLKSSEEVSYKISTFEGDTTVNGNTFKSKKKILAPKLVNIDPVSRTGSLVLGDTSSERVALYVDSLEKHYSDGTTVIKEVYYDSPKKVHNYEKIPARTVVKTIKDNVMKVTIIDRQNVKKADGKGEDQKIWTGYEINYTVTGSEEIKAHNNKIINKNVKLTKDDMIKIDDLDIVERDISKNDQKLVNIIDTDMDVIAETVNSSTNNGALIQKQGKIYARSLAGQDFKNESKRLSLPILAIIDNFMNSKAFMEERFKNLSKNQWSLGHSNISDTIPIDVGNGKGKMGKVDLKEVLVLLKDIQKKNIKNNTNYIEQNIKVSDQFVNGENISKTFKDTHKLVKNAFEEVIATGSDMYVTGGDPKEEGSYAGVFNEIGLHDTNYYHEDAIITVLPASEGKLSVDFGNKLGYGFDGLETAMKVGTEVITQESNSQIDRVMSRHGIYGATDIDSIMIAIRGAKMKDKLYDDKTNYELERKISAYQINAYMLSKDYTVTVKNGYNVWTTKMVEMTINGEKKKLPMHLAKKEIQKAC